MRAKRKIKKGEELTIFYTDFMESRHSIRQQGYFGEGLYQNLIKFITLQSFF